MLKCYNINMPRKLVLIFLFCFLTITSFGTTITVSNYKSYIGKKIKFADTLPSGQGYYIANEKFMTKKYAGKILTITNIELDRKGQLVIYLTGKFPDPKKPSEQKEKVIKVRTKTDEAYLENVFVYSKGVVVKDSPQVQAQEEDDEEGYEKPVPVKQKVSPKFKKKSSKSSFGGSIWLVILIIIGAGGYFWFKFNQNKRKILETVTGLNRGRKSERDLILELCKNGVPADAVFHDLYVPVQDGKFEHVDLLVLSSVGIIVFEIKDYGGLIYGNGKEEQWTQIANYGKEKNSFHNPITQNAQHITQLQKYLKQNVPYFSIVVFDGKCELKEINAVPQNTFITKPYHVMKIIEIIYQQNPAVEYDKEIKPLLNKAVANGSNPDIRNQYIGNIQNTPDNARVFR